MQEEKFTCYTAPLLRKCIGQELRSLVRWIERVSKQAKIIALDDNVVVYEYNVSQAPPDRRAVV